MKTFLESELKRFEDGFKIFALEKKKDFYLQINNLQVRLYGYIDRIDILNDKYYIIDYKTGKLPNSSEYSIGDEFTDFQLPCYALIFSQGNFDVIDGMFYYQIGRESRIKDICEKKDKDEYLRRFQKEILLATIGELLDPQIPFYQTENSEFCSMCVYKTFCGITGEEYGD